MPMQFADTSSYTGCADADCVIDAIDSLPEEQMVCEHPRWMEGYRMPSLRWLLDNGRLEVAEWGNEAGIPAALGLWPHGAVKVWRGKYGDFARAKVWYTRDSEWHVLAHELMHVAGPCPDIGPLGLGGSFWDYSPEQKAIMSSEGVGSWTETSYYLNEDQAWHLPNKQ